MAAAADAAAAAAAVEVAAEVAAVVVVLVAVADVAEPGEEVVGRWKDTQKVGTAPFEAFLSPREDQKCPNRADEDQQ